MSVNATSIFLVDLTLTVVVCAGLVAYISKHLRLLLIELCGTAERANFWQAFSNVALVMIPLIFALDCRPNSTSYSTSVFEIAGQLRYALIGFMGTLASLAVILLWFIPRQEPRLANPAVK
jgi:hypothetical protein